MKERRKYLRLDKNFSIKLKESTRKDFDITTETKNISANGAYCSVNQPIEPMTKMQLTLLLPIPGQKTKKIKRINCEGVVVRKEKNKEDKKFPYQVGIFFNNIDSLDRKFLQSYVNTLSKSL